MLRSVNSIRIISETTQIWGKEFPAGMLRMVPGNSSFLCFLAGTGPFLLIRTLLAQHRAILHYKSHVLDGRDILERITAYGHDICVKAGLELSDLVPPT